MSEELDPGTGEPDPVEAGAPAPEPAAAEVEPTRVEDELEPGQPEDEVEPGQPVDEPARAIPPLREVAEIKKPSTLGGIFYLGVLATALIGIGIAATGAWRTGASWLAASLVSAAAARVVLSDNNAGMLRVRHKALDALILAGAGVAIVFLVWSIPDRPR